MRGDEVNGKRREGGEQIWTGNLRMLHEDEEEEEEVEETGKTGGFDIGIQTSQA